MPLQENRVKYLNTYIQFAPVLHREMIRAVTKAYKDNKVSFQEAEKVVLMLASKNSALQRSGRADEAYVNLMRKAGVIKRREDSDPLARRIQDVDARQKSRIRQLEKEIRASEGDTKSERLVTVILYTLPEKKDGAKGPKEEQLDKEDTARFRKYLNKRWRGLHQFWKRQFTVKGGVATNTGTV